MARGLTRGKRRLSVTPLRRRDRRLVHRPSEADSLGGSFPVFVPSPVRYVRGAGVGLLFQSDGCAIHGARRRRK